MTATNHALTGALVALVVGEPVLAIPLALVSHFVIDMIPHFDSGLEHPILAKRVIIGDTITVAILLIIVPLSFDTLVPAWLIFACMLTAISPDLAWGWRLYKYGSLERIATEPMSRVSKYHLALQWSETHLGALVEVAWTAIVVTSMVILR